MIPEEIAQGARLTAYVLACLVIGRAVVVVERLYAQAKRKESLLAEYARIAEEMRRSLVLARILPDPTPRGTPAASTFPGVERRVRPRL